MKGMKMTTRLDELERILNEKIEKDEEWDLLEIKSVEPIYSGELRKKVQKLSPQVIVFTILIKYFEKFRERVKITKLAKLVFEVDKKVMEPILTKPVLSFKADNFGPFTKEIYDILCTFQNLDLIKIENTGDKMEITVTEDGLRVFKERVEKELPKEVMKLIEIIIERYGSLSLDELLRRVYNEYPEFAEKSLVKEKYLSDA